MNSINVMQAMIFAGFLMCAILFRAQYLLWRAQHPARLNSQAALSAAKRSEKT